MDSFDNLAERFKTLLECEREALLNADTDALQKVLRSKETLLDLMQSADPEHLSALQSLSKLAARNHSLLEASMDGIRSVAQQVAAIRQKPKALATYNSQGRVETVDAEPGRSLEKRA